MMAVYLLCFERGLLGGRNRHYVGYAADDVERRIQQHRRGTGSAFAREMKRQGIGFQVSQIWQDFGTAEEREIKRQKQASRYCQICKPGKLRPIPSVRRAAEAVEYASQCSVALNLTLRTAEAPIEADPLDTASDYDQAWEGRSVDDDNGYFEEYPEGNPYDGTDQAEAHEYDSQDDEG